MTIIAVAIILGSITEPHENIIEQILKRLGVSKVIMVLRDTQLFLIYQVGLSMLMMLIFWLVLYKSCLSIFLFFFIVLLYLI